jgi:hypothetical protein
MTPLGQKVPALVFIRSLNHSLTFTRSPPRFLRQNSSPADEARVTTEVTRSVPPTVHFAVPEAANGQDITLRLYDVLGREVRTVAVGDEAGRREAQRSVDDLPSGVYVLRLQVGGTVKTQKMTVVR